jgi:hypothetical protein
MNNFILLNKLKNTGKQIKLTSTDSNKYNPDVYQIYDQLMTKRDNINYNYSKDVWKPIIGSIENINISKDDFKIKIDNPDFNNIKSKYVLELEERGKERLLAEKLSKEYNDTNKKESIPEIKINTEKSFESFIELKTSSLNIKNKNDIDNSKILESIDKLDSLLDTIKNF